MEHSATIKFKDIFEREIVLIRSEYDKRGIKIPGNSRYARYFSVIERLAKASSKEDHQQTVDDEGMGIIVTSLKEIGELYGIIVAFKSENGEVYRHKLEEVIKGSEMSDASETRTQPRDILWELNLAAHLKKANFEVELAEPDVVLRENFGNIHIACKRPNSINGLEKIIRKARKQIIRRGRGLFALSIDKLINPEFGILQGENMEIVVQKIDRLLEDFLNKYRDDVIKWVNDRKVFGAIYSLSLVADDHNRNIFVNCQKKYLTNLCSQSSPYFLLIERIAKDLEQA